MRLHTTYLVLIIAYVRILFIYIQFIVWTKYSTTIVLVVLLLSIIQIVKYYQNISCVHRKMICAKTFGRLVYIYTHKFFYTYIHACMHVQIFIFLSLFCTAHLNIFEWILTLVYGVIITNIKLSGFKYYINLLVRFACAATRVANTSCLHSGLRSSSGENSYLGISNLST